MTTPVLSVGAVIVGVIVLLVVLWDTFETVVLPRTVTRTLRLARVFYMALWKAVTGLVRIKMPNEARETILGLYGPVSLLLLLGLWAFGLVLGFALVLWGLGGKIAAPEASRGFGTYLYLSGTTLFTLGLGDVTPVTQLGRFLAVLEAGMGLGFLAMVISYLPVLYQSFATREVGIVLLDARAGSPPTAGELLLRHARAQNMQSLVPLLREWETWAAELLESHLSYPVLATYRSQHDRQSWISALTAILDTCAFIGVALAEQDGWGPQLRWQANMTYAMARHAAIDLALVLGAPPRPLDDDRLSPEIWRRLCHELHTAGVPLHNWETAQAELSRLREQYEPYVRALGYRLWLKLPPWLLDTDGSDNWQVSAWGADGHFTSHRTRAHAKPRAGAGREK